MPMVVAHSTDLNERSDISHQLSPIESASSSSAHVSLDPGHDTVSPPQLQSANLVVPNLHDGPQEAHRSDMICTIASVVISAFTDLSRRKDLMDLDDSIVSETPMETQIASTDWDTRREWLEIKELITNLTEGGDLRSVENNRHGLQAV